MKDRLITYYEEKYALDRDIQELELIPQKKYPTNRYEACLKYFTENFKQGGTILELGAGNGILANSILHYNNKVNRYIVSDFSKNRLNAIKNNIKDNRLHTKQIDVEAFDYDTIEKADAIIMVALIEHLIDPLSTMKKIRNALKPGGFVYIETPNVADYGSRFKLLKGKFPSTASRDEGLVSHSNEPVTLFDEGHLHYFTYRSLSGMLTRYSGFNETIKYHQMVGKKFLGKRIHHNLAKFWPEMFSSLVLIAK